MIKRFASGIALLLLTLPLTACSSGDDDSSTNTTPNAWSGHTYLLSLAKIDWTQPRGIGADLFGVAPAFIFKVSGTGNNLSALLATGPGTYKVPDPTADDPNNMKELPVTPAQAKQDTCGPTSNIAFDGSKYPSATIGPSKIRMFVSNMTAMPPLQVTADVYNLKFTDILPNGSTQSTTGTLEATMDFRQLYVLFQALGPTRTPDSVCQSLHDHYTSSSCTDPSCEVKCLPCPDGQPYCLSVKAEDIGAVEAPNLTVTEVSEATRPATCADSAKPQ